MIRARFDKSEDGKTLILTVQGHAGAAEKGEDIICASASILAYTAAQVAQTMRNEGKLKKKPTIRITDGDAVITCKPAKAYYAEALHAFSVVQVGYRLLAHNYPSFVQVTMFGNAEEA